MANSIKNDEEQNKLLNRVEDKYLVNRDMIPHLSAILREKFKDGDIDSGVRYNLNKSIYLDNPDLNSLRDGLDSVKPRIKIRIRQYAPNLGEFENVAYLEIKCKQEDGMTNKVRVRIFAQTIDMIASGKELAATEDLVAINKDITKELLQKRVGVINDIITKYGYRKQIEVRYNRAAFTGDEIRVTIDDNIRYMDVTPISEEMHESLTTLKNWSTITGLNSDIENDKLAVVEVKHQDGVPKWLEEALDEVKAKKVHFSKYCSSIACYLTNGNKEFGFISDAVGDIVKSDLKDKLTLLKSKSEETLEKIKIEPGLPKEDAKIELGEGANKGRVVNVKGRALQDGYTVGLKVKQQTGEPPLKVKGTAGHDKTGTGGTLKWGQNRKHKLIKDAVPATRGKHILESSDVHDFMPHNADQKKLVHGIDINDTKDTGDGITSQVGLSGFGKNARGQGVIVKSRLTDRQVDGDAFEDPMGEHYKSFTTAQREGLYHNLAHHLGLGKYVPTTSVVHDKQDKDSHGAAGNHYSVMERVKDGEHYSNEDDSHRDALSEAYDSGDLHKLGIMNSILGNSDRHGSNFLMSPKGLHLIDHGMTFDYHNSNRDLSFPDYLDTAIKNDGKRRSQDTIHPEAVNWLKSINPEHLDNVLNKHKIHRDFKNPIISSLRKAQNLVSSRDNVTFDDLHNEIKSHINSQRSKYV